MVDVSHESKKLWRGALLSLKQYKLLHFLKKLEALRQEIIRQFKSASESFSQRGHEQYMRDLYSELKTDPLFEIDTPLRGVPFSVFEGPRAFCLRYQRLSAYIETVARADPSLMDLYQSIRFFLPDEKEVPKENKIRKHEKELVDEVVQKKQRKKREENQKTHTEEALKEFIRSVPAQLDQLAQRIEEKLERESESVSKGILLLKRDQLDRLRTNTLSQGLSMDSLDNLDRWLTVAIEDSILCRCRNYWDFFHWVPHTVVELRRIRARLRSLQSDCFSHQVRPNQRGEVPRDGVSIFRRSLSSSDLVRPRFSSPVLKQRSASLRSPRS